MENKRIVAVSFQCAGKLFDFDARDLELENRDLVIVETERGKAMGTVIGPVREENPADRQAKLKTVLRKANEHDIDMADKNAAREEEALRFCKKRVKERGMEMKLVRAEYLFDGSKIVFYFTADGRIDFRELVRDLAQHFRTRIEMRQIGVRDEAKMVGGLGCCGRELCCCSYLRSFAPVSVKMAKAQGLALNPSKISGQCGRLLCCLGYEYDTYNELRKNMPKCGKKVQLGEGTADVVALNILAQTVTVADKDGRREIALEELNHPQKATGSERPEPGPAKKSEEKVETTSKETGKGPRRPRRRGGRGARPRTPEQQGAGENRSSQANGQAAEEKSAAGHTESKNADQKPNRNRRRRSRRPRRRPEQTPEPSND